LVGQEIFTKILLLPIHHVMNCWSRKHKKIASRFVMLAYPLQKIKFPKAELEITIAPALAHKSSDWITLG